MKRGLRFWRVLFGLITLVPGAVAAADTGTVLPRLVVVVSVDQLPGSYLERFQALFGEGGFRRLMDGGADFRSCQHGQAVTLTGPGHAVILSGAYPLYNGVVGNSWYSRERGTVVGCVEDTRFPVLTAAGGTATGVSPLALRASTVGDVLRTATRAAAKVVSVSLKDRAAVLMGGWRPTGAYWYDARTCHFVTSSYYTATLPKWVSDFNAAEPCAAYVGKQWTKLRSDIDYAQFADVDDAPYEVDAFGLGRAFPHQVKENPHLDAADADKRYAAVVASPFGNDLLLRFALAAMEAEMLGRDAVPDLLAISLSSNDYVGHLYGPHSEEALDMMLRTDRVLADLMQFLDRSVGEGRWVLALTSDHGVAPIPEYLEKVGELRPRPDHYHFNLPAARRQVERGLGERFFGDGRPPEGFPGFFVAWAVRTMPFVYVDRRAPEQLPERPPFDALLRIIAQEIGKLDGVAQVYRRDQRTALAASADVFDQRVYRSWDAANGGDLFIRLEPYWVDTLLPGTNHGTAYAYDTHVPMLLYGTGIHAGQFYRPVAVVDLASTLSLILRIPPPPYDQGQPLVEALGSGG